MVDNRKDLLRECLIELNLEFDIIFDFFLPFIQLLFLFCLSIQICTYCQNDTIVFMRLEELKEPQVKSIRGEEGYEW